MAKLVKFDNKVDLIDSPEVPDNQKMKAQEFNEMRDAVNQKIVAVDSTGIRTELSGILLSQKRSTTGKIKVQLQDETGKSYFVETTADQVYINDSLKLDEALGGNLFFLSQDESSIEIGNLQEWIAKGKPKA